MLSLTLLYTHFQSLSLSPAYSFYPSLSLSPTEPSILDELFKKWANPSLFLFIFVLFTFQLKRKIYNLNYIGKFKKK